MKALVMGGSKSGKSDFAQTLAIQAAEGGALWYVATMRPADEEDEARVASHRAGRAGMGFITRELPDVTSFQDAIPWPGTVLVDSVTALLANEMFSPEGTLDNTAPTRVADCLLRLAGQAPHIVFVCDTVFSDAIDFDAFTNAFRAGLAYVAARLADVCEGVIEVTAGVPTVRKLPGEALQTKPEKEEAGMHLIIGGAFQGKTAYAAARWKLHETDIFTCPPDTADIDFSLRCINKLENFALACVRRGVDPVAAMLALKPSWENAVLICADISSGVVPTEPVYRAWREANGKLTQMLASHASQVVRVFAGLPERLK